MKTDNIEFSPIDLERKITGRQLYSKVQDASFSAEGYWGYRVDENLKHIWLNPRPSADAFESIYANYYTHQTSDDSRTLLRRIISYILCRDKKYPGLPNYSMIQKALSFVPSIREHAYLDVLNLPYPPNGRSILDIGCGNGMFLVRMQSYGWKVCGVDPDVGALKNLKSVGIEAYSDLADISEKFDYVILSHVIEHVPDPIATLKGIRSALREGGKLIIVTPNSCSLGSKIFKGCWRGLEPPRHFNIFSKDSLKFSLEKSGYRIHEITTTSRLARGFFYVSLLTFFGMKKIELRKQNMVIRNLIKVCSYIFQALEFFINKKNSNLGEEIFCVSTIK